MVRRAGTDGRRLLEAGDVKSAITRVGISRSRYLCCKSRVFGQWGAAMAKKGIIVRVPVDAETRALWERAAGFPARSLAGFVRRVTTEAAKRVVADDMRRLAEAKLVRRESLRAQLEELEREIGSL